MATAVENVKTSNDDDDAPEDNATEQLRALAENDPNARVSVMVTMPATMKLKLVERAESDDVTLAKLTRELLADAIDFDLPDVVRTRARKYKSEEERIAAQKARNKGRRDLINTLLKAYKEGAIDLEGMMDDDDDE